jgi:hypothetical protein
MLIGYVLNCQGGSTLLWHNTYRYGEKPEWYEHILNYYQERKAWMAKGDKK